MEGFSLKKKKTHTVYDDDSFEPFVTLHPFFESRLWGHEHVGDYIVEMRVVRCSQLWPDLEGAEQEVDEEFGEAQS